MKGERHNSKERLAHILQAITDIELFVHDVSAETFLNDQLISSAVLFQFSIIGEAVNYVDVELLSKYEYPWHKVRAFRNLISHVYFQIKLEAVWEVIVNELPELKQHITKILKLKF